MKIDELKSSYDQTFGDLNQVIATSLGQVMQKELTIENEILQETDLKSVIAGDEFPKVVVKFQLGTDPNLMQNLFMLPEDFVLQFYAWMLADDPAESVSDEHFEGLTEAVQQVFGQLKMAVPDDEASFQVNDLKIFSAKSAEELQEFILDEPGIACSFYLSIDESVHQVAHYFWMKDFDKLQAEDDAPAEIEAGEGVDIQPAEFAPLKGGNGDLKSDRNMDMIMDVELEVSVEIDRKMILISDLLKLSKGSIVELEKSAGEPLNVYVNGRKFAEGEVVVIDDRFGIRITQLLSPKERVKSLG